MKKFIYLGMTVIGGVGGWLGSLMDHSGFGLWGFMLGTVGSVVGIWAGYKVGRYSGF
jgi:hypothetical protein